MAISIFVSRSQRVTILHKHMNAVIPLPSTTRWNFNIRTVNKVYENLEPFKKHCLAEIQSTLNADETNIKLTCSHTNVKEKVIFTFSLETKQ